MFKMTIKLTFPITWHKEDLWSNFKAQTPNSSGVWNNIQFEINNDCNICDSWVVLGNLNKKETVFVKKEIIFIPSEEVTSIPDYPIKFISQFCKVATSRQDILTKYQDSYKIPYLCPWQIQKTYDELSIEDIPKKEKNYLQ